MGSTKAARTTQKGERGSEAYEKRMKQYKKKNSEMKTCKEGKKKHHEAKDKVKKQKETHVHKNISHDKSLNIYEHCACRAEPTADDRSVETQNGPERGPKPSQAPSQAVVVIIMCTQYRYYSW